MAETKIINGIQYTRQVPSDPGYYLNHPGGNGETPLLMARDDTGRLMWGGHHLSNPYPWFAKLSVQQNDEEKISAHSETRVSLSSVVFQDYKDIPPSIPGFYLTSELKDSTTPLMFILADNGKWYYNGAEQPRPYRFVAKLDTNQAEANQVEDLKCQLAAAKEEIQQLKEDKERNEKCSTAAIEQLNTTRNELKVAQDKLKEVEKFIEELRQVRLDELEKNPLGIWCIPLSPTFRIYTDHKPKESTDPKTLGLSSFRLNARSVSKLSEELEFFRSEVDRLQNYVELLTEQLTR